MWTCASPAPPGPPPTANPTSPSTSASPIATAPTCANATSPTSPNCDPKEIAAIELALRFKEDLAALGSLDKVRLSQGLSVGAVWTAFQTARRLGIEQALGSGFPVSLRRDHTRGLNLTAVVHLAELLLGTGQSPGI